MTNTHCNFADCHTVEAVKARYRELAKKHHPDLGGCEETMKQINAAYHAKLENLDGQTSHDEQGREHTYNYNEATEEAIMQKIHDVIGNLKGTTEIWLIGLWLWVFNTEPKDGNAEVLKTAGFRWNRNRKAWTWKPYKGKSRRSNGDIKDIAARYGAKRFSEQEYTKDKRRKISA